MPLSNGGGGGGGSLTPPVVLTGTAAAAVVLKLLAAAGQTADVFQVTDDAGTAKYLSVSPTAATLTTNPQQGRSALNISDTVVTIKDETGATMLDIEGGFASLGPGGEVAAANGQVFLTLPTADPGVSGQLWNSAGTVKVSP